MVVWAAMLMACCKLSGGNLDPFTTKTKLPLTSVGLGVTPVSVASVK